MSFAGRRSIKPKGNEMLLDENGEPEIFTHSCLENQKGQLMPFDALQEFAVEILADVFSRGEKGMQVLHKSYKFCKELPNLIIKSINNKIYYVAVYAFMLPNKSTLINDIALTEMTILASKNNAQSALADMGFFSFSSDNSANAIMGGEFAVKYDGLKLIENKNFCRL